MYTLLVQKLFYIGSVLFVHPRMLKVFGSFYGLQRVLCKIKYYYTLVRVDEARKHTKLYLRIFTWDLWKLCYKRFNVQTGVRYAYMRERYRYNIRASLYFRRFKSLCSRQSARPEG